MQQKEQNGGAFAWLLGWWCAGRLSGRDGPALSSTQVLRHSLFIIVYPAPSWFTPRRSPSLVSLSLSSLSLFLSFDLIWSSLFSCSVFQTFEFSAACVHFYTFVPLYLHVAAAACTPHSFLCILCIWIFPPNPPPLYFSRAWRYNGEEGRKYISCVKVVFKTKEGEVTTSPWLWKQTLDSIHSDIYTQADKGGRLTRWARKRRELNTNMRLKSDMETLHFVFPFVAPPHTHGTSSLQCIFRVVCHLRCSPSPLSLFFFFFHFFSIFFSFFFHFSIFTWWL